MENATDALYIGFAVLAFVVALSLSIFSFSNVISASQSIIDARDKTTLYSYIEPQGTERTVTSEDIIPTLYRAYYENYMIKFEGIGDLYKTRVETKDLLGKITVSYEPTSVIDLEGQQIRNHEDANRLITALLQGDAEFSNLISDISRFSCFKSLHIGSFYDILRGKTFKEKVGVYYMEDRNFSGNSSIDDVNKTKKRIITYTAD